MTLTGRIRYRFENRPFRRRLVVLMVEERYQTCRDIDDCFTVTRWRDATPNDMETYQCLKSVSPNLPPCPPPTGPARPTR